MCVLLQSKLLPTDNSLCTLPEVVDDQPTETNESGLQESAETVTNDDGASSFIDDNDDDDEVSGLVGAASSLSDTSCYDDAVELLGFYRRIDQLLLRLELIYSQILLCVDPPLD